MENLKSEARKACMNASCGAKLKEAESYTLKDWIFSLGYTITALLILTYVFSVVLKK